MSKVIITAAICGGEVTRAQTPYIPITAEELASEAARCVDAGASIIHLHVRKPGGTPTQEVKYYKEAIAAIKAKCKTLPIIQPSTGGSAGMTAEERGAPLALRPEMASLDCGTTNFGDEIFVNDLPMMRAFAKKFAELGVMPELECFDIGHVHNSLILVKEGLLKGHLHYDLVLGVQGAMNGSEKSLVKIADEVPQGATWTVAGIGRHELPLALKALQMGGHVRVGLEDNIYFDKGVLAKGSYELVERVVTAARERGREVATPDETRQILGLRRA